MVTATKTTPITLKGKAGFLAWVQKNFPASVSAAVLAKAQSLNSIGTNVALGRLNAVRRRRRLGQLCCTAAGPACMSGPTCYGCASVCTQPTSPQAVACCGSASSCWMSAIGGTLTAAAAAAGVALCSGAVQSNLTAAGRGTVPALSTATVAASRGVNVHASWGGLLFIGLAIAAIVMLNKEDKR